MVKYSSSCTGLHYLCYLVGTKQENQGVDSKASRQDAVYSSIGVLGVQQVSQAVAKALSNLGDAEFVARGLTVDSSANNSGDNGQSSCQPGEQQ